MSLKSKFAIWEQKAKNDTPKGPCARPQSSMSTRGGSGGGDNVSVVSAAATDVGPFGPVKKKKKKPAVLDKIEQAQAEINGRIKGDLGKLEKERLDAEKLKKIAQLREAEEAKKILEKKNTIQNWVNNIAEENESEASSSSTSSKPPPAVAQTAKQPTKVVPKVKPKYTTAGRRTSSMSGIDIAKKVEKVDLSKLPQPASLSVPFVKNADLKKTPKKAVEPEVEHTDWSIVDLQQGFDSEETSSYEMIDPIIEVEPGHEQVFVGLACPRALSKSFVINSVVLIEYEFLRTFKSFP